MFACDCRWFLNKRKSTVISYSHSVLNLELRLNGRRQCSLYVFVVWKWKYLKLVSRFTIFWHTIWIFIFISIYCWKKIVKTRNRMEISPDSPLAWRRARPCCVWMGKYPHTSWMRICRCQQDGPWRGRACPSWKSTSQRSCKAGTSAWRNHFYAMPNIA